MYEAIQELREQIDEIELKSKEEDEEGVLMEFSCSFSSYDIGDICNNVGKVRPYTKEGWDFYYNDLSAEEVFKLLHFMTKIAEADEVNTLLQEASKLTIDLLHIIITLPCQVALKEEEAGYLEAVEVEVGHYVDKKSFEQAHEKMHEVMKMYISYHEVSGWVRNWNINKN